MNIHEFLSSPAESARREGPYNKIVLSSRVRLARNLKGLAFPGWAKKVERVKAMDQIRPAVESLTPPAPEPPAAEEPTIEPAFELPVNGSQPGAFRVVVRLSDGDGVEVGEFRDFGTAMQGAQEVIDQFSHSNGSWPFYAGRFIRPDLIISVDVVDGAAS